MIVGLVIGPAVSIFQAVTQIQEQPLSFIPTLVGLAVAIVVAGPWMLASSWCTRRSCGADLARG